MSYYQILSAIVQGVIWFLTALSWMIILNVLLALFISPKKPIKIFLERFTAPIISPFRIFARKLNRLGFPFDWSPILALLTLTLMIEMLKKFI